MPALIMSIPTGASFQRRFKRPYILIHRVDLHRILLDACETQANVELMPLTGGRVLRGPGRPRRGCAPTDDRTIEGAALIGADGLRSTIRQQMRRRRRAAHDRLRRASHHRADGGGAAPTCIATMW